MPWQSNAYLRREENGDKEWIEKGKEEREGKKDVIPVFFHIEKIIRDGLAVFVFKRCRPAMAWWIWKLKEEQFSSGTKWAVQQ